MVVLNGVHLAHDAYLIIHTSTHAPQQHTPHIRMDWYGLTNETILPREKWRKSEQWFGLLRHHAEIVASEHNQLWHYMLENCPLNNLDGTGAEKFCILDEHFPAVALAVEGRDKETDCYGHLHFTEWREGGALLWVLYVVGVVCG